MKRDTFIQMVIFKKKIHFCENYPCTPVFEGLKSIKKLHDPSQTNSIENYVCFQVVGFKILRKSAKNRPKNGAKMGISQSKAQVGSKSQWHMKD